MQNDSKWQTLSGTPQQVCCAGSVQHTGRPVSGPPGQHAWPEAQHVLGPSMGWQATSPAGQAEHVPELASVHRCPAGQHTFPHA